MTREEDAYITYLSAAHRHQADHSGKQDYEPDEPFRKILMTQSQHNTRTLDRPVKMIGSKFRGDNIGHSQHIIILRNLLVKECFFKKSLNILYLHGYTKVFFF